MDILTCFLKPWRTDWIKSHESPLTEFSSSLERWLISAHCPSPRYLEAPPPPSSWRGRQKPSGSVLSVALEVSECAGAPFVALLSHHSAPCMRSTYYWIGIMFGFPCLPGLSTAELSWWLYALYVHNISRLMTPGWPFSWTPNPQPVF